MKQFKLVPLSAILNPFTVPACKISGLKDAALANSILSGPIHFQF